MTSLPTRRTSETRESVSPVRCRYRARLTDSFAVVATAFHCPHDAEHDGLCLFHRRKLSLIERCSLAQEQLRAEEHLSVRFQGALDELILATEGDSSRKVHFFIGFEFPPDSSLDLSSLTKQARFTCARFQCDVVLAGEKEVGKRARLDASFSEAEFCGRLWLWYVDFEQLVVFDRARFCDRATFTDVRFLDKAIFRRAHFDGDLNFEVSSGAATGELDFSEATLNGRASFFPPTKSDDSRTSKDGLASGTDPLPLGRAIFQAVKFGSNGSLWFSNVKLDRVDLYETDLDHVEFVGVQWDDADGRPRLYGEVDLKSDVTPLQLERIAATYSRLVAKSEAGRDVDRAEQFHIGEMEIRRRRISASLKDPVWRRFRKIFNGFVLYRLSSKYGTSVPQAVVVLAFMLCSAPLLFMWTGITHVGSPASTIQYHWSSLANAAPTKKLLSDYANAWLYTLDLATLEKQPTFEPVGPASKIAGRIVVLMIGAQAALLLFAIRRRFKR